MNFMTSYLGFHKGGAKFLLAASAQPKAGPNHVYLFFPMVKKKSLPKGARAQWPPKYATVGDREELSRAR